MSTFTTKWIFVMAVILSVSIILLIGDWNLAEVQINRQLLGNSTQNQQIDFDKNNADTSWSYPHIQPFISQQNKTIAWNHYLNGTGELTFFHARKAAGTTIGSWLKSLIRNNPNNPNELSRKEAFSNWNKKNKNPITSTMTNKADTSLFLISLRHPIERILSHYEFEFRWGCNTCCHTNSYMLQQLNNNQDPNDEYPNLNASNYLEPMMIDEWWVTDGGCRKPTNTSNYASKYVACNIFIEDLVMRVQRFEIDGGKESILAKELRNEVPHLAKQQLIGGVYLYNYYLWMFCCNNKFCNLYKDFIETGLIQKCFDDAVAKIKSMDIVILTEWLSDQRTMIYVNELLGDHHQLKRVSFKPYPHKENLRGRNYMIHNTIYDKLVEWNKWDLKLYEFVKKLAYERMRLVWMDNGTLMYH